MALVTAYLSNLPPDQSVVAAFLYALTPGFLMVLGGFTWVHVDAVRKGR